MSNVTAESLREIGADLHGALLALIAHDGRLPRPTDLARVWELDQTLCVRTLSALRNDDPLRVLHQLPSTFSLRAVLEKGRGRGIDGQVCAGAERAIGQLEEAIANLGGKKSNLDTLIGSQLVEAREKIEATSKQSIFRGMSNLLGLQSDVVMTAYFVHPSEDDPEWCDELAVYGSLGMRRLRPELTILAGGRILHGEPGEVRQAEAVLHGGRIDRSGFSVALKRHSTEPFPEVEMVQAGKRLLYTLPGEDGGESREITLFFASIDRNASPRYRRRDLTTAPFAFLPRNPSKDMLLDAFVRRDIWRGAEPRLEITRGESLLTLTSGASPREIDRLDLCESIQPIQDPRGRPFKPVPQYVEMLHEVCEGSGIELDDYRHYRLHVRYPVVSLSYTMQFPLPDRPVGPFYGATGTR